MIAWDGWVWKTEEEVKEEVLYIFYFLFLFFSLFFFLPFPPLLISGWEGIPRRKERRREGSEGGREGEIWPSGKAKGSTPR